MFGVIQFFGASPTNPLVVKSHTIQSRLEIPPRMASILDRACTDCHSNDTRWPWYSHVAPIKWWVMNHVNGGRKELNFSEWTQYQAPFAAATVGAMGEAARRGLMPLVSYKALHPQARLSDEEIKVFYEWSQAQRRHLLNALWDTGTQKADTINRGRR